MVNSRKVNKLLIITGPTATGKTALGLEVAKKYNGEIISADSRQVYKYMDIGTGKATDHFEWGINLVEPDEQFSVSDWVNYAIRIIGEIRNRKKLPIIVGGTGQYIKELLRPAETLHIPQNYRLRKRLFHCSTAQLQEKLQEINPKKWERMNSSDRNNPRRLVRAIEVAQHPMINDQHPMNAEHLIIGLTASREFLNKRIDQRVEQRLAAGMEKEREFLKKYKLPKTLGYNDETPEQWKIAEHQYAKRQMDYLKKFLPETAWFNISISNWQEKLWPTIQNWLAI